MSPSITLTASQQDFNDSLPGFLREHPVPVDENNEPTMTAGEHIKKWLQDRYYREANYGTQKIAGEAVQLNRPFK